LPILRVALERERAQELVGEVLRGVHFEIHGQAEERDPARGDHVDPFDQAEAGEQKGLVTPLKTCIMQ
jgi:hypothetical protein